MTKLPKPPSHFREFYEGVGHCITQWSAVENELFHLCFSILNCQYGQAGIVYYRTPSIEARINLIDELVEFSMPLRERENGGHDHPILREWREIVSTLRALLPQRNLLAHSPVRERATKFGAAQYETWLEAHTSDNEATRPRTKEQAMTMFELWPHYTAVISVSARLEAFRETLRSMPHE